MLNYLFTLSSNAIFLPSLVIQEPPFAQLLLVRVLLLSSMSSTVKVPSLVLFVGTALHANIVWQMLSTLRI